MREDLMHFDEMHNIFAEFDLPDDIEESVTHIHLGAHQTPCTIKVLQAWFNGNPAFNNLRNCIMKFL